MPVSSTETDVSAAWHPPGLLRRILREFDDGRQDPVCEVFDSRQKTDGADLLHQVGKMLRGAFSYNRIEVTVKSSGKEMKKNSAFVSETLPKKSILQGTDLSPPDSRALMLRVGVQCCTMQSSAASTSCRMKALLSPAFCSNALTVPSSSWSMDFCRCVYRSPRAHTATLETPDRRFLT